MGGLFSDNRASLSSTGLALNLTELSLAIFTFHSSIFSGIKTIFLLDLNCVEKCMEEKCNRLFERIKDLCKKNCDKMCPMGK